MLLPGSPLLLFPGGSVFSEADPTDGIQASPSSSFRRWWLSLSCVQLSVTAWTIARQAPLSMEFSRLEYWNGLPFPTPRDLLDPGIESTSPASPAFAGGSYTTARPRKPFSLLLTNFLTAGFVPRPGLEPRAPAVEAQSPLGCRGSPGVSH